MKRVLVLVASVMMFFVGCSRQPSVVNMAEPMIYDEVYIDGDSHLAQLESSLLNWNKLKDSRGTSYQYTIKNSSGWGGIKSETTIVVHDDFVINRYHSVVDDQNVIRSHWREEGFDMLNDHPEGAPTKRMDALYDDCRTLLATEGGVTLSFDGSGILQTCNYGKRGIFINNFMFILR